MKKHIIIMLSFIVFLNLNAQEKSVAVEKNQFKINVLLPGIVYEHGLSDKNTLYSEISLGLGYRNSDFYGTGWTFYPNVNEQFRHYYNLNSRTEKDKVTAHNSGGFFGLAAVYGFHSLSTNSNLQASNSNFTIAPVWGFQRTFKGNFNLDLNLGPAYTIDKNDKKFNLLLNFSLGWVIGK